MSARYLWTRKCAVKGCNSSATEYRLFRFPQGKSPRELLRYHKWVDFTKNPSLVGPRKSQLFLCKLHFAEDQFRDSDQCLLISGAVPTIQVEDNSNTVLQQPADNDAHILEVAHNVNVCDSPLPQDDICYGLSDNESAPGIDSANVVNCVPVDNANMLECIPVNVGNCILGTNDSFEHDYALKGTRVIMYEHDYAKCNGHFEGVMHDHDYVGDNVLHSVPSCQEEFTEELNTCEESQSDQTSANITSTPNLKCKSSGRRYTTDGVPHGPNLVCVETEETEYDMAISAMQDSNSSWVCNKRSKVLDAISCTSYDDVTPRKKKLIKFLKQKQRALCSIKKKYAKQIKQNVKCLRDISNDPVGVLQNLFGPLSLACANFLASQIMCSKKKPRGRRWSQQDKLLALAIYKRSPKSYRLFSNMFTLPVKKTLGTLLANITLESGLNRHIFDSMTKLVSSMEEIDRTCILLFDEMSLREHLQYDSKTDRISGFVDLGHLGKTAAIGNHALVFMVKGLHKKWKQPVAFYFTGGNIVSHTLVELLCAVIKACQSAGLKIVATVCDMGTNNTRALKLLGSSEDKPFFCCGDDTIITLYDAPHLLKCVRNMLFKHDVIVIVKLGSEEVELRAKWSVIEETHANDCAQAVFRSLYKLTAKHLEPRGAAAMKVSVAAQILSQTMAATINTQVANGSLSTTAVATAHFVGFCNKLFDSVNGATAKPQGAGSIRCQLRKERENLHLNFWEQSIKEIKTWKVVKDDRVKSSTKSDVKVFRPPCLSGWITTLQGLKLLWDVLKEKGFRYVLPRSINQDPIEHLFGCVRSNCGSNMNPTVTQFVAAMKTSLINGLVFTDLKVSNCGEEESDPGELLTNLQEFISPSGNSSVTATNTTSPSNVDLSTNTVHSSNTTPSDSIVSSYNTITSTSSCLSAVCSGKVHTTLNRCYSSTRDSDTGYSSAAYVAGSIARRIISKCDCEKCKHALIAGTHDETIHCSIMFREYSDNTSSLTYPSEELINCIGHGANLIDQLLSEIGHNNGVRSTVSSVLKSNLNFQWLQKGCSTHAEVLENEILLSLCNIALPWWCTRRNQELSNSTKVKSNLRKLKILNHK